MSLNALTCWLRIAAWPFRPFHFIPCSIKCPWLRSLLYAPKPTIYIYFNTFVRFIFGLSRALLTTSCQFFLSLMLIRIMAAVFCHFQAVLFASLLKEGSVVYTFSWTRHKSKRRVKSIGAAKILAAVEAINEGKI